ncbi:Chromosome (plasmid) partitioning protein ParB / Stage 0 sporulation protein J [Roseibacterium elongatum DSM 19469]|uniref:Chromosome (Plasmid) partitioning protein ParB / Stage 0 sporulation protein J n=1 Tax=Roseicyclus elongatus DSM 19469 TaxID=1294273 RepID=W8S3W3_9RHOB|nr:ParB/RepB/Spo0J family partition protein [Roseibacterium elongatum]AHM03451.1 Chromosome (plasmid) partitioning protein ParB / Stage 0 sporulation protein J [Roseibacterium elongatum DSM 19469]
MAQKRDRKGLGRGLSALMADIQPEESERAAVPSEVETTSPRRADQLVPIERIFANPDQPRRAFSDEALDELAASIREKGVIQPLILRVDPADSGRYQIVAGERRWRAAQRAQLHELPAIIRDFTDTEVLEVAIIENIQRADLNAVEEAQGYRQLMDRFGHTQDQLATAMGKSRSHIANLMRLLQLPDEVQDMLRDGRLSAGHARALITTENPVELARKAVAKGLSVREVEKLARKPAQGGPSKRSAKGQSSKDADTRALEGDLSAALGMKVSISHDEAKGTGNISINYKDLGELDDLMRLLSAQVT